MNESLKSAHFRTALIYQHSGDLGPLLLHLLATVEQARRGGMVRAAAWQRHWLRGPHLKIHVQITPEQEAPFRALIGEQASAFFHQHHSDGSVSQSVYRRRYAAVAAIELMDDDLSELAPDQAVVWQTFSQREQMFGTSALAALARDFLFESHDQFAELLQDTAASARGSLLYAVARIMMAFPQGFPNPAETSSCFRSHAEGFLHAFRGRTPLREQFLERQRQIRPQLEAALTETLEPDAWLRGWTDLIQRTVRRAEAEFEAGATLPGIADFQRMEQALPPEVRPERSTFQGYSVVHRGLEDPHSAISQRLRSSEVQTRRFIANLMYERFTALGLTSGERYMLCYLVAHTLEHHHFGTDWWSQHQARSATVGAGS